MTLLRPAVAGRTVFVVVSVLVVAALVVLLRSDDRSPPPDRPAHLVDLPVGSIRSITVTEAATGRTGRVERAAGGLRAADGTTVPTDRLRRLEHDLAPLLAIRLLDRRDADYGLDPPRLEVAVVGAGRTVRLTVGGRNFDGTAVYVRVRDRTALVLPRIGVTLAMIAGAGQTGQPAP